MKYKTVILVTLILIGITISIGLSFKKIVIDRDYNITVAVGCDNNTESCFIYEEEGEISYYKYLTQPAYDFPECDPSDCEPVCSEGSVRCEYTVCSEETESEWDICAE